jgi:hypothetical protein
MSRRCHSCSLDLSIPFGKYKSTISNRTVKVRRLPVSISQVKDQFLECARLIREQLPAVTIDPSRI